jgi:hypothetical protein
VMPCILAALASFLLLWGLGNKYLWQDEAQTAVLGARMLRFGRPLAYDGLNLITNDMFVPEEQLNADLPTKNPQTALDYYYHGRSDATWKLHPWGQFIVAAASFKVLGQSTLAARLPFALVSIATVLLLYRWVSVFFGSALMAQIATVLVILNAYWILHGRQCRYYSLSSLCLVLVLISYTRWQRGGPWGATAFIAAAWCWFQVDYGTVWPVLAVLFVDAFVAARRYFWRPALVGGALAATLVPFVYYYDLWHRSQAQAGNWQTQFALTVFNTNEYVVPMFVLLAVGVLLAWRWKTLPSSERRIVLVSCGMIVALSLWIPCVAPSAFLRYVIMAAPVGCILNAWVLVRGIKLSPAYAWLGAAVLIITAWLSIPLHALVPPPRWYSGNSVVRAELYTLSAELFGHAPDPNRIVIDWLKQNVSPTDEILVNYEDLPLMFYLPNPIRGGIPAFRVEDDAKTAPNFIVIRQSVGFVHWPVFQREIGRYQWDVQPVDAPDIVWGNNPDPIAQAQDFNTKRKIIVARRRTEAGLGTGISGRPSSPTPNTSSAACAGAAGAGATGAGCDSTGAGTVFHARWCFTASTALSTFAAVNEPSCFARMYAAISWPLDSAGSKPRWSTQ